MLTRTQLLFREMIIPGALPEVFDFFSDAANLERITPPELGFEIVPPVPTEMAEGTLIEYRLSLFRASFGWRTLISAWNPPNGFTDVQLKGPYRRWEHTHTFTTVAGGTRVADHVVYELPLHPLSLPALPFVQWQLRRIFDFRAAALRREFG